MGAPTSDVGYTSATTRKGDHEVYMDMWWHWGKIVLPLSYFLFLYVWFIIGFLLNYESKLSHSLVREDWTVGQNIKNY
jgi:hypothetical protein